MSANDCFISFGKFGAAILSREVLELTEVYAGGVRIVEGRRGEHCKELEL
jgi:hypothetical protein